LISPELVKVEIYVTGDVVPDFDTLMTVIGTTDVEEPEVIVSTAVLLVGCAVVEPPVVDTVLLPDLLVLVLPDSDADDDKLDVLVDAVLLAGLLEEDDPLLVPDDTLLDPEVEMPVVEFWLSVEVPEPVRD
jgi:hypothetical protein